MKHQGFNITFEVGDEAFEYPNKEFHKITEENIDAFQAGLECKICDPVFFHATLPIKYTGWDTAGDYGDIQFYNVEFLEDFGPFAKGERVDSLGRFDAAGELVAYDGEGQETKKVKLRYVAV